MTARPWLIVGVALAGAACSGQTGVLVAVTGGALDELELHVGALDGKGDYVLAPSVSTERIEVRGRNLRANPYELLVREQDGSGEPLYVRVLALAYRREQQEPQLVGFAVTEPPQRFIRGEVVRRAISVIGVNNENTVASNSGCYRVRVGEKRLDLVAPGDRDCDGSQAQVDCDDGDPAVRPGLAERCDGKDNNCDKAFAPRDQSCYVRQQEEGPCRAGTRVCLDAEGKGFAGDCEPVGDEVLGIFCDVYDKCDPGNPTGCVDAIERRELACTVQVTDGGDGKLAVCGGASWPLERPAKADGCRWHVEPPAVAGITAKLRGKHTEPAPAIEDCEEVSLLVGGALPKEGGAVVAVFDGRPAAVVEAALTAQIVDSCGEQPMSCK